MSWFRKDEKPDVRSLSARDIALGYGWICPYCQTPKDEGQRAGVLWNREMVCADCGPIIQAARRAAEGRP